MGNAIALEAHTRGAAVTLVTTMAAPEPLENVIEVETAAQMADAVWSRVPEQDVIVMAAAVADFRPATTHGTKLARRTAPTIIELEPTPDILAGVIERRTDGLVVGFAAETGSLDRAVEKARSKGVDLLVANDVLADGSGFGTVTNQVTIITPDGSAQPWPLLTKAEVASRLWDIITGLRG